MSAGYGSKNHDWGLRSTYRHQLSQWKGRQGAAAYRATATGPVSLRNHLSLPNVPLINAHTYVNNSFLKDLKIAKVKPHNVDFTIPILNLVQNYRATHGSFYVFLRSVQ